MSNYRHCYVPGGSYFFTVVTERRAKILGNDLTRDLLRVAFLDCFQRWPPFVDAMVMLNDHLHAIWTMPPGDAAYPKRWARLKNISLNPGLRWAARNNPARRPASHIVDGVFGSVIMLSILCGMNAITNGISTTFITIR